MSEVERYRRHIEAGTCPICGAGPFKSISGHTNRAHDVDRHELRRRAEIPASHSIASPEVAAACSERAKSLNSVNAMSGYVEAIRGKSVKHEIPDYSRRLISENIRAINDSFTPAERRRRASEVSRKQSPESRKKQGRSLSEWHKRHPLSDEEKTRKLAALHSEEARKKAAEAAAKRRKPCGTEAAYNHRKCRCEPCRAAKRESRAARKSQSTKE